MRRLLISIIAGFCNVALFAQVPPPLTLEECIRLAEEHSYRLQSDDYEIVVAENRASIAESRSIPSLIGELASENRFLQPYYFNQVWATVHAEWSLGDLIKKTGRSANQDIETRRLEKEQTRLSVIGRSTSLYMSILQVKKQMEILGLRLEFLQQHHLVTQGMWKAGIRSQLDVLQTETEIVKLQEDTARLAIVENTLKIELARKLGWDHADSLHLATVLLDSVTQIAVPVASLTNLSDNPVMAAFDSRVAAQQFRGDEITAGQIPHLMLGSGYMGDGDPAGDGNYWQISAGVIIPIYSGNFYKYQKQGSKAIVESLYAQKSEAERDIMIHLVKIQEKLINLKKLMDLQMKRQTISMEAVDFAELNYKAGIASNLDYLSSQQRLINTELSIEETRLEYTVSLIEFYITINQTERIVALGYTP